MNTISSEQLLSQIRTLGADLQVSKPAAPAPDGGIGDMFKATLDKVNETQKASADMKTAFENGSSDASLAEVMIASQKADLAFRAVTEVRNKLVQAYQDIMNMPV